MNAHRKLDLVREDLGDCRRCGLCETRKNIVFGVGDPNSPLMFVGEGPGADEDAQGEPFVGRAGKMLDKMIAAMGFARSDVYIANVVKCRPAKPGQSDRAPDQVEAGTCGPFLEAQIRAIEPALVVTLGRVASHYLLKIDDSMTRMHGRIYQHTSSEGDHTPVIPTYHPSFLLRQPSGKEYAMRDLKKVLEFLAAKQIFPPNIPHRSLTTWKS